MTFKRKGGIRGKIALQRRGKSFLIVWGENFPGGGKGFGTEGVGWEGDNLLVRGQRFLTEGREGGVRERKVLELTLRKKGSCKRKGE